MPTFRITAPDGRKTRVTMDSPPTDEELDEIFAALPAPPTQAASTPPIPLSDPTGLAKLSKATSIGAPHWTERRLGGIVPSVAQGLAAIPQITGAVGGILGGLGGTAALPGPGTAKGAILGAGLGGAIGESERRILEALIYGAGTTRGSTLGDLVGATSPTAKTTAAVGEQFGAQALMEATGQGAARGFGKLLAPGARSLDRPVMAAAERQGVVNLPAAAISTSKIVPLTEGWAAKGISGGGVGARYTEATRGISALADDVVAKASKLQDPSAQGKAIADGLNAFRSSWIETKNSLYDVAEKELVGVPITLPKTVQLLDKIIADKQAAARVTPEVAGEVKRFAAMRKKIAAGDALRSMQASDVRAAQREWHARLPGAYADPFTAANKGMLKKLSTTLDDDFVEALRVKAPEAARKLAAAKRVYVEGIRKINGAAGTKIHRLARAGQYDKIAQGIVSSRVSIDDIPRIMEVAGTEGTEAMRVAVLADIVGKAKTGPPGHELLTPLGLQSKIKSFGPDRLQAILTPEQWLKLSDVALLSGSMQKGTRVVEGSQTAYLGRIGGYGAVAAGAAAVHPAALLAILGDVPTNKFIASKAGQRWLTTGWAVPAPVRAGIRQAPRAAGAVYPIVTARAPVEAEER